MNLKKTLAAMQLDETTTTVTNLLAMDKDSFNKVIMAIRKEYKELHNIAPTPRDLNYEGQKAFNFVLKKAKEIQTTMDKSYGVALDAEKALSYAFNKLAGKLGDFTKEKWLMYYADRIATVLQNAKVKAECDANGLDILNVAENAVWMGYKSDGTAYADDIIRHGIGGETWNKLNEPLFKREVICDYIKMSDRMKGLDIEQFIPKPAA